ncbi:hypothetical protein JL720_5509 [Aureococcus anophagefferens]|nr:hypothetical protein JL720_5509 [Aureococcus anophagefferens]
MPDAVAECLFEMLLTEAVKLDFPGEGPIIGPSGETASSRPELHGYEVGYRFVERIAQARALAADHLEAIKFICKDVWNEIFGKQIDKLQTNHRGVFFPCGVLRGALANLGIVATVTAEYGTLPSCSFSIRIQGNDAIRQGARV